MDFVMEFYNATFPETMKMLIGEEGEGRQKSCLAPSQDFRLPEKNEDEELIVKYLTESRALEKNLVMEVLGRGEAGFLPAFAFFPCLLYTSRCV